MIVFAAFVALIVSIAWAFGASGSPSPSDGTSSTRDQAAMSTSGSLASWNPNVACLAESMTIAEILGPAYPSQSLSGSPFQRNDTLGGVPHPRALSPPCTITNVAGQEVSTLVQINGVYLSEFIFQPYDCSDHYKRVNGGGPYPNNATICEWEGTILAMGTTDAFMQIEFDQDWLAKGYCGPGVSYCDNSTIAQYLSSGTVSLDVEGFVYWDGENWELHPFTAWRVSAPPPPPPDFAIGADSTSMRVALGGSSTSAIGLTSLDGFAGTVSLNVSIRAVNVPPIVPTTYPTVSLSPESVTLAADGTGGSTLTVSASLLATPGTYAVTVTATSGAITHSVTITVEVTVL
jgi:hypothetical protein